VKALAVLLNELLQAGLEDGQPARPQGLDAVADDVPDRDVVAEGGEARTRDQADVPRPEDPDLAQLFFFFPSSGRSPLAIASIVSFDNESRSVFTTQ
jgi:hypothetical protein